MVNGYWLVLTTNQASHMVDEVSIHHSKEEALEVAQQLAADTKSVGRRERHYITEVERGWGEVSADGEIEVTW